MHNAEKTFNVADDEPEVTYHVRKLYEWIF